MEAGEEIVIKKPRRVWLPRQLFLMFGLPILLGVSGGIGYAVWKSQQPKSLLPASVASSETAFLPYFYYDEIPVNYTVSKASFDAASGIMLITLTRPGRPPISLSEQLLSDKIDLDGIMRGGETVEGAPKPAIINKVPGRYVGIMADSDGKTLILFNTTNETEKRDLSKLISGLLPVK